jgi:saccharopine dehydrogenase (NAD+, L-lysine-forming)
MTKQILILGGYGTTGRMIASLMLKETDAQLVLAGRSREKGESAASSLNGESGGQRVRAAVADAADVTGLRGVFRGMDIVIVASSTSMFVDQVARAALEERVDYFDIQYSTEKLAALQSLSREIEDAGCCFITDGGFHPGLPAGLVRLAAQHVDTLEQAHVGSVIKADWSAYDVGLGTLEELLSVFRDYKALKFMDGRWQAMGSLEMMTKLLEMDFGDPFGRQPCYPMFLEEMRDLPAMVPGLRETGFFVGGFNWFVDWIITPVAMAVLGIWKERAVRPMARWMGWGLKSFSRPPFGTVLKLEAVGKRQGQVCKLGLTLSHADGYWMTAIPVVACLLQYLEGAVRKPGLWFQAHLPEPARWIGDMERMGVGVRWEKDGAAAGAGWSDR